MTKATPEATPVVQPAMREEVIELPDPIAQDIVTLENERARLEQMSQAIRRTFLIAVGCDTTGPQWTFDIPNKRVRRLVQA